MYQALCPYTVVNVKEEHRLLGFLRHVDDSFGLQSLNFCRDCLRPFAERCSMLWRTRSE